MFFGYLKAFLFSPDAMLSTHDQLQDVTFTQAAIDSQKDILIFSIDRNFSYRTFNNAFVSATSFAYGTQVTRGMNLFDSITTESDRSKARANCDRAFSGEKHYTVEKYGTLNPAIYETHYIPIVSSTGDVIGVSVLSSNITARVVAEQQVQTLTKELESFTYTSSRLARAITCYQRIFENTTGRL